MTRIVDGLHSTPSHWQQSSAYQHEKTVPSGLFIELLICSRASLSSTLQP
ncbi:hypothetical protein SLEP1_g4797 [Rubroshorea leprosula]|uniref:Uncharacterized protein n=1 Tax=Rubroshorea leprosula TaxID=152421 RepID=A0AAV5HYQ0_9ROSI|nr:hypothetical protein SLEP1_g4797 [Rubroshorea leprosula]